MPVRNSLLHIIEMGGYPDFRPLYDSLGLEVMVEGSVRKGLARLKKSHPAVVVAEFIYSPTYGTKLSNIDSLFGGLERLRPAPKLIVFLDRRDDRHLDALNVQHDIFARLYHPVREAELREALQRALMSE